MPNIFGKDKPDPENQKRYSIWMIVGLVVVLALLIWIVSFSYGEQEATAMEPFTTSVFLSGSADVMTGNSIYSET